MYCENCGTKIKEEAEFCQDCGHKTGTLSTVLNANAPEVSKTTSTMNTVAHGDHFYSEDWRRKKIFAVASMPYFDVMVDKQYLYLIRLPSYSGQTWGLILGLVVLNIIGAAIGSAMGSSSDTKKRKWYRSAWIDVDKNITSHEYDKDIYIKVPLKQVKSVTVLKSNKFDIDYEGKKLTLQKNKAEMERLFNFIEKHVL